MKTVDQIKLNPRIKIDNITSDGFHGIISLPLWQGSVIGSTGAGWDHISVVPFNKRITPSWDDMTKIKDWFWNDDEAVIQIHPQKDQYVNNVNNCLHLWRCTYKEMVLPPSCLVGIRKGQTQAELMKEIKEAYEIAGEKF